MTTTINDEISLVESLLGERKTKEALELIDRIRSRRGLSKEDSLACALLEIRVKLRRGELKDLMQLAETALQTALKQKDVLSALELHASQVEIAWQSGEFDAGLRALTEGERLIKDMQPPQGDDKARTLNRRKAELLCSGGVIHWYKGNL